MSAEIPSGFVHHEGSGAFLDLVGPVYVRDDGERPVIGLRLEERHANRAGAVHGGMLATLADFALGRAIHHALEGEGVPATVSLTTDFLRPASPGDWLEAHIDVERLGGKLAFADCSLLVEGREVVRGRAVFVVG